MENTGYQAGLLRSFFRRSLGIAVILSVALLFILPYMMRAFEVSNYKTDSIALMNSFIDRELNFDLDMLLRDEDYYSRVSKSIEGFMEVGNFVEFKVWLADTTNAYSFSDPALQGRKFPDNAPLLKVLKSGEAEAELEEARHMENQALKTYGLLLEIYIPVTRDGHVVGAVEVYRKAPEYRLFGSHTVIVAATGAGIFVLLYVLLYGTFRRAALKLIDYERGLEEAYGRLGRSYFDTIRSLLRALEYRDMETEGHCERVLAFSLHMGQKLAVDSDAYARLLLGSYLHDIGKIGVPDAILLKPGRLTPEERVLMQRHVEYGFEIIRDVEFLLPASEVILGHHEKWDGTGYPRGVRGEAIPITARIFALSDVVDALLSKRPYKAALPYSEVRDIIRADSGTHFDPALVEVFSLMTEEEYLFVISEAHNKGVDSIVSEAIDRLLTRHFRVI